MPVLPPTRVACRPPRTRRNLSAPPTSLRIAPARLAGPSCAGGEPVFGLSCLPCGEERFVCTGATPRLALEPRAGLGYANNPGSESYKRLAAILIKDLDGSINVNAAGNLAQTLQVNGTNYYYRADIPLGPNMVAGYTPPQTPYPYALGLASSLIYALTMAVGAVMLAVALATLWRRRGEMG